MIERPWLKSFFAARATRRSRPEVGVPGTLALPVLATYTPMAPTQVREAFPPRRLRGEGRRVAHRRLQGRPTRPPVEPQRPRPHAPLPRHRGGGRQAVGA